MRPYMHFLVTTAPEVAGSHLTRYLYLVWGSAAVWSRGMTRVGTHILLKGDIMTDIVVADLPTTTHKKSIDDHRHGMRFLQSTSEAGGGLIVRCFGCFKAEFIPDSGEDKSDGNLL